METFFILNQNLIHLYWSKKILLSKRNGTFTIHNNNKNNNNNNNQQGAGDTQGINYGVELCTENIP